MRITNSYTALLALCLGGLLLVSSGCASNPNVEGAKLNLRNGNFQKALDNVEIALENDQQNAEAWLVKGDIHNKQLQSVDDLEIIHSQLISADYGMKTGPVPRVLAAIMSV